MKAWILLFALLFALPVAFADIPSSNCSRYALWDTGKIPLGCGATPANASTLSSKGWTTTYGNSGVYWNVTGSGDDDGWIIYGTGQDAENHYPFTRSNITCSMMAYFDESSFTDKANTFTLLGFNSDSGFQGAVGFKGSTSLTTYTANVGSAGYVDTGRGMIWNQWFNITVRHLAGSNLTIWINGDVVHTRVADAVTSIKAQMFYSNGNAGQKIRVDSVKCWNGSLSDIPMDSNAPPPVPAQAYDLELSSRTNNSLMVEWDGSAGNYMVLRGGVNVANTTSKAWNLTGLLNNTQYNVTIFAFNASGTNSTYSSENSRLFTTAQNTPYPVNVIWILPKADNSSILSNNYTYVFNATVSKADITSASWQAVDPLGNVMFSLSAPIVAGKAYYNVTRTLNMTGQYNFTLYADSVPYEAYMTVINETLPTPQPITWSNSTSTWFQQDLIDLSTTQGVLLLFFLFAILIFIVIMAEVTAIPVFGFLGAFALLFFGIFLSFGLSMLFGAFLALVGVMYAVYWGFRV